MDYYGLLFLYYLKGLSGKSVLKLFFNIEAGGTEQLLPENTSTPTTTPILADIQYPDGLRTDQYFTCRETPTTVSNKARIKTIKGNTLVWNQLVQNGNFAGTSNWTGINGGTISVANNEATISLGASTGSDVRTMCSMVKTHQYLLVASIKTDGDILVAVAGVGAVYFTSSSYETKSGIFTWGANTGSWALQIRNNTSEARSVNAKNIMLFDLTQMFGTGNEPTSVSDFTSLFPLSYYDYNAGTLLSFNGTGLKTAGKNQLPILPSTLTINGITFTKNDDGTVTANGTATGVAFYFFNSSTNSGSNLTEKFENLVGRTVTVSGAPRGSGNNKRIMIGQMPSGGSYANDTGTGTTFVMRENTFIAIRIASGETCNNDVYKPMLRLADTDDTFEPYTSSTLSLPISTYFPNGMKSAGSVYDELTPRKAITRVGTVVFNGTQSFTGPTSANNFWIEKSDVARSNDYTLTMSCDKLDVMAISGDSGTHNSAKWISAYPNNSTSPNTNWIYIHIDGITTKEDFTTWLQANPVTLNYELKTPTETPITTEDANEALSLLMGKSVSSNNAKQMIDIITKGE